MVGALKMARQVVCDVSDIFRACQAERRISRPLLRIAESGLRINQQVLTSGHGNGLWRDEDSGLSFEVSQ